jgi:NAD+ synthase (glutamine-hydrolysing)
MAGGFAPLKDVLKTLVYRLSKWRNTLSEVIPERIIARAPSAELRANQTDQDSLPDYDVLDKIIKYLVEGNLSSEDIIARGLDAVDVKKVARLLKLNEYKRRQSAVGPKVTLVSFAKDWRYPITHRFNF